MGGIIKIVMLLMVLGVGAVGIAVYWILKPLESGFLSSANTSSSVNMTNYYGYVETVNYWPILGWITLLSIFGFAIFSVVKAKS